MAEHNRPGGELGTLLVDKEHTSTLAILLCQQMVLGQVVEVKVINLTQNIVPAFSIGCRDDLNFQHSQLGL